MMPNTALGPNRPSPGGAIGRVCQIPMPFIGIRNSHVNSGLDDLVVRRNHFGEVLNIERTHLCM